jgi:hypothetical protein
MVVLLREIINIGAFGQVLIIGQTDSGFLLDSILHKEVLLRENYILSGIVQQI